jgi:peptidoglycan/xylan/chitin deacetylase (PgdA/CDA1 family)
MTTTSELLEAVAMRLAAPLAKFEERALGLRTFERLCVPKDAALTVTCDDGGLADLKVLDVLSDAGVAGVFAVSPELIGRQGFLSYAQLAQIRDAGHEVAFHGTTHAPFTRIREEGQLQAAIHDGMKRLADEGFTVSTLVYPYGTNNRFVRAVVATTFACAFTTWIGLNRQTTNRYAIRRIPFGSYAGRSPPQEAWYRGCIEQAAAGHCWPTLMLHPGAAAHTGAHNVMLRRLLGYARELGVPVRTAKQHLPDLSPHATGMAQASRPAH